MYLALYKPLTSSRRLNNSFTFESPTSLLSSSSSMLSQGYLSLYALLTSSNRDCKLSTILGPVYVSQARPSASHSTSHAVSSTSSNENFKLYKPLTSSNKHSSCCVLSASSCSPTVLAQSTPSSSYSN